MNPRPIATAVAAAALVGWLAFVEPGNRESRLSSDGSDLGGQLRRCVRVFNATERAPTAVLREAVVSAEGACVVSFYDPRRDVHRGFVLDSARWQRREVPAPSVSPNTRVNGRGKLRPAPGY